MDDVCCVHYDDCPEVDTLQLTTHRSKTLHEYASRYKLIKFSPPISETAIAEYYLAAAAAVDESSNAASLLFYHDWCYKRFTHRSRVEKYEKDYQENEVSKAI